MAARLAPAVLGLALLLHGVDTADAQDRARSFSEMSQQELLDILRSARPAPTTVPPADRLRRQEPNARIEYDPRTGRAIIDRSPSLAPDSPARSMKENRGSGPPRFPGGTAPKAKRDEGPDQPARDTVPTKPSPTTNVLSWPRQSVHKLLMRFDLNGVNWYYVCSGSSIGSFHVLTAGHCLFNWDPNEDGNTADARWAAEVWTWAAQTDIVQPFDLPDFPYGQTATIWMRSYTGWTADANWDYDYGLLTVDRRIGDHTGWMGMESGVNAASLNFTGYPTETPYVPAGSILQYPGYDANNVDEYYDRRIAIDAYIYGGHSGGPAYRYIAAQDLRNIQGINSTSDRVGNAGLTRITDYMITDITNARNTDEGTRPPTAQPNMIEYTQASDAKDLLTNSAEQGQSATLKWNTLNAGFASSGSVFIDAYLSTDATITTADRYIGTFTLGVVPAWEYRIVTSAFTIPLSTPPGSYRVGWIMRTSPDQDPEDNWAVIPNETLQVAVKPTAPAAPILLAPDGKIDEKRPEYRWVAASGNTQWATSYKLVVREKAGGTVFTLSPSASSLGCAGGGTCVVHPSTKLDQGRHTWTVRATNTAGTGPEATGNFNVKK